MDERDKTMIKQLEKWYLDHHRKLPFRESHQPYHIWISEIMLQQTQVDTVIPYYEKFIDLYPTVKDLADTSEETLLKVIEGLGYYRRFKYMLKAAKKIVKDYNGIFPSTYKEVLALPGVGEYTAGAIMSIAFNKPFSATDGNVIRVLSRVKDIKEDMRQEKHKNKIKSLNQSLIEKARPEIYTQAIMELGALICKPKNPKCNECPLANFCMAYEKDMQEQRPYLSKKAKKKTIHYNVYIIKENSQIYLRKRTEKLLGGMYEFPQFEENEPMAFSYEVIKALGHKKHIFTHLVWKMDVYEIKLLSKALDDWQLIDINQLNQYPMATAHKKIANLL